MAASDSALTRDVLILGAGPAGLVLGRELKQHGVPFLILERGATVAHSWQTMPAHMKLLSPWKANRLPGGRADEFAANAETSRAEYCAWLLDYARQLALPIQTGCNVEDVTQTADGLFRVQTSVGVFQSRLLVNATGCFSNPFTPEFPGARHTKIPLRHTADYRDAETLRAVVGKSNPLVLVVGKRLSAGQTMVELVEAGFTVALSHRGQIRFGSGPLGWWLFFRLFPLLEAMKLKLHGSSARGVDVLMQGGQARKLIESGVVRTFPELARFERDGVVFTDGARLQPDAVVFATGFRPALGHLASLGLEFDQAGGRPQLRDMESATVPGLFFIGLDHLRNFQSRFIRGIRNDAVALAGQLDRRLRFASCPATSPQPAHTS